MTNEPRSTPQTVGIATVGLSAADHRARLLAFKGSDKDALLSLVVEAVTAYPLDTLLLAQAEALLFKGDLKDKAATIAAHAVQHGVANGDLMVQHANNLWQQGEGEQAEVHYRAAIGVEPKNGRAYFRLACMYRDQQRYREALPIAAQATALEPSVGLYWRLRSDLCSDLGDTRAAEAHRRTANRIKNSIRRNRQNG